MYMHTSKAITLIHFLAHYFSMPIVTQASMVANQLLNTTKGHGCASLLYSIGLSEKSTCTRMWIGFSFHCYACTYLITGLG